MRKLILALLGLSTAAAAATSVVACTAPAFAAGLPGQRLMAATDGGNVQDHSFNQQAYETITEYGADSFGTDTRRDFVEAQSSQTYDLISSYKLGLYKGADALVVAGFTHAGPIATASKMYGTNKTIVMADAVATGLNNVISLSYNSELSGFAAGFDAASWATKDDNNDGIMNGDKSGDGIITMSTFAGISSKYGVDNYNWGYLVGMQTFNNISDAAHQVYFGNVGKKATVDAIGNEVSAGSPYWYTNSFGLGAAETTGMLANIIDENKSDIVFGVAGPQTQDVLEHHGYQPYVVGVDVDQVESYPGYESRFISSATKNLKSSIKAALAHSKSLMKQTYKQTGVAEYWTEQAQIDEQGRIYGDGYWDGYTAQAQPDWSMNQTGGKNILQQSAVGFENAVSGDEADLIGKEIKAFYAGDGTNMETPTQYLSTNAISSIATQLAINHKDALLAMSQIDETQAKS